MINTSMNTMSFVSANTSSTGPEGGNRPPGPPPPGKIPPGLEEPVASLSESDQASVKSLLEAFTPEQHEQLKSMLDEFKTSASTMTTEEIGASFYAMLTEVSGTTSASESSSPYGVDTYV